MDGGAQPVRILRSSSRVSTDVSVVSCQRDRYGGYLMTMKAEANSNKRAYYIPKKLSHSVCIERKHSIDFHIARS